jgi:menaquinone-dependent protoporphyrinogen oxidase
MRVLVAYASRHGSTAEIAQRISAGLNAAGLSAEAVPVAEVTDVAAYDAYVIGSAAYMFHWLREATRFVKHHARVLADRPVWLFSSGPLGTDRIDEEGHDILEATRPREFDELDASLHPRGMRVFFGAWDPEAPPVGFTERVIRHLPAYDETPVGDFRDWPAIGAWAAPLPEELLAPLASGG